MAKSKKSFGTGVAVGSGIGMVAGAALGAAAVAMADKNVRDQAEKTLNKAGKNISSYTKSAGMLGGKATRKKSTKSGMKKKTKK